MAQRSDTGGGVFEYPEPEARFGVTRSPLRPDGVWAFFERIVDVTDLNPAEEQAEAWDATDAHSDNRIGMAVVDKIPSPPHVFRVATVPDRRREGVGSALLRKLIDQYGPVTCNVRRNNEASRSMLRALGFDESGSRWPSLVACEYGGDHQ